MAIIIDANIHVIYLITKYITCYLYYFILREPSRKTTASDKGKIILSAIRKNIQAHFPELFTSFNNLTDSRKRKEYSMAEIIVGALFMYIFKETSL